MGTSICDAKHLEFSLDSSLNAYRVKRQGKSIKCRERSSGHIISLCAAAWSHGAFSRSFCIKSTPFSVYTAVPTTKQKFYHFAITVGGKFVVCPNLPHVPKTSLFQRSHNCVIPTFKEFIEIFGLRFPHIHSQHRGSMSLYKGSFGSSLALTTSFLKQRQTVDLLRNLSENLEQNKC